MTGGGVCPIQGVTRNAQWSSDSFLYIYWIRAGAKTWEIRGSCTAKGGRIALLAWMFRFGCYLCSMTVGVTITFGSAVTQGGALPVMQSCTEYWEHPDVVTDLLLGVAFSSPLKGDGGVPVPNGCGDPNVTVKFDEGSTVNQDIFVPGAMQTSPPGNESCAETSTPPLLPFETLT